MAQETVSAGSREYARAAGALPQTLKLSILDRIQFTGNPRPEETQESVILPASAPQTKMCLKEGDLGPALREEGGT